ncbi:MAG: AAA family ATPase [Thaumarchaeota archaeon]|nr:AAA family ATPase [Nitrososphaerota archaeon]
MDPKVLYMKVSNEVSKVVVGKTEVVRLLMVALLAEGHVLLEGVPGVAKTLIARAFSKSLGLSFKRIQFTPDMLPSDITGTFVFNPKTREFDFRMGPVFANMVLADEINRATPKTQSALLEAMQEKQVTIEGTTKTLEEPFVVLATQNPLELEGTYPLPEAQLDRFMFRVLVQVSSHSEEVEVLAKTMENIDITSVNKVAEAPEVLAARNIVKNQVQVSQDVLDYIVSIVESTRGDRDRLLLGGSPRASVQLLQGSRSLAAIKGRSYVIPDDVKELSFHLLNHRLILNPEFMLKAKATAFPSNYEQIEGIVTDALASVQPPR